MCCQWSWRSSGKHCVLSVFMERQSKTLCAVGVYGDSKAEHNSPSSRLARDEWTWNRHKTLQQLTTLLLPTANSNTVNKKQPNKNDENGVVLSHFYYTSPVTFTLEAANQFFHVTLWLLMTHHHTKFCLKRCKSSENIVWTYIHWNLELWSDLDLNTQQSSLFTR